MKKIILLILAIIIIIYGYSWFSKSEVPTALPDEIQLEKYAGVVNTAEELGALDPPSDFVLLTENGENIYIKSVTVNLLKYKRRQVEAEGKWDESRTFFVVENVVSLTKETQIKTLYTNPVMGVKFQYPSVWELKENKTPAGYSQITIMPYEVDESELPAVDYIIVDISENNKKLPLPEWLNLDEQYRPVSPLETNVTYQLSFIGSAQLDAVKKTTGTGEKIEFFVSRDKFIYRFAHYTISDADKDMYRNAFYDLVMSFESVPFSQDAPVFTPDSAAAEQIAPQASVENEKSLSQLAQEELDRRIQEEASNQALQAEQINAEEAKKKTDELVQIRAVFVNYIKQHIREFAPEPESLGGTWFVEYVEFAHPEGQPENFSAIYVVYEDGHDLRKLLLDVPDKADPSKLARIAYFEPGKTTDWTLIDGEDSARGNEKTKVNVAENGATAITVKKGMSLLTARAFGISIQYPSKWYWAAVKEGYAFSDKPVTADNILLRLTESDRELPAQEKTEGTGGLIQIGTKMGVESDVGEVAQICVKEDSVYCLQGDTSYKEIMKEMLKTLAKL